MKKLFLTFIIFSFCISCSTDSGLNSSEDIYDKIIGKWAIAGTKTIFESDKTYIDSTFLISNPNQLILVEEGNYSIERNILKKTNFQVTFLDSIFLSFFHNTTRYTYDLKFESFNDSLITFKAVEEFESLNGPSTDLWSSWNHIKWILSGKDSSIYTGRVKYTYEFFKNSSYFNYGIEYLDNLPLESSFDTSTYSYNPPYLTTNGIRKTIEFKDGYMYWYYGDVFYTRVK